MTWMQKSELLHKEQVNLEFHAKVLTLARTAAAGRADYGESNWTELEMPLNLPSVGMFPNCRNHVCSGPQRSSSWSSCGDKDDV